MPDPLEDVQDAILDRLHRGETVDREATLAAHPEHADALREFFRVIDVIEDAPPPDAAVPASLGEFRIVRELGHGGMGIVYEAEQVSLKRRVALKVLPPALRTDPRLMMRFRREAEAAGKLRHPGIVPVYSVGEVAGTPFFAMELVQGRSLDATLRDLREGRDCGVPSAGEARRRWAVETAAKVADALDYAHGRGILHRDVKPGNVIVDSDGAPRLTDFGLALDVAAPGLTMAGEVFGSIHYMSPEQAVRRESPVDARTDVYSLAVTLYELLTLRLPYDGTTSAELLTALTLGKLVPIRDVDPSIPQALGDVVMHALRREPPDRYPTAAAFAADLRAVLAGAVPPRAAAAPPAAAPPGTSPAGVAVGAVPPRTRTARVTMSLPTALVVVPIVVVLALLVAGAWTVRRWVEGADSAAVGVADALTYDDLDALADGKPPGAAALARTMRCAVRQRAVLSRKEPGTARCTVSWRLATTGRTSAPVVVVAAWEVRADSGPWTVVGSTHTDIHAPTAADGTRATSPATYAISVPGAVSDALMSDASRKAVTFRHRVTVRVVRRPPEWDGTDPGSLSGGTAWVWTGADATCSVYDEYPADYPLVVTGPDVDDAMRRSVLPASAKFVGLSVAKDGRRTLDLFTTWDGPEGPLPTACHVDLSIAGRTGVVGTAAFTWEAADASETPTTARYGTLQFALPDDAAVRSADEAALLLALDSGERQTVRLAFRPSRAAALSEPDFSRYWGGTAETEIAVVKGTNTVVEGR